MSGPLTISRLARRQLPVDAVALARFLIGKILVRELSAGRLSGRIVETEAYPVGDSTGYAFRGRTERNAPLFMKRGHAYIRLMYGASHGLNVSAEREGVGAAVLIRALVPIDGIGLMRRRRAGAKLEDLARGPGRLTAALRIDPRFNAADLCENPVLWIGATLKGSPRIGVTTRIGLSRGQDRPLRFYEVGSPFVSGPRRLLMDPRGRTKARRGSRG
ncbi:MAG TPA: DNA-3-methyladenine glycosylase [Steroidobacteraceae bacterium]|nr:DNA-3-methyladenine glycosylase [Steroidobacteraceae bacterium]